jgi:hypothetical protein
VGGISAAVQNAIRRQRISADPQVVGVQ